MELTVNDAIFDRHFSFPHDEPEQHGANFATYGESERRG